MFTFFPRAAVDLDVGIMLCSYNLLFYYFNFTYNLAAVIRYSFVHSYALLYMLLCTSTNLRQYIFSENHMPIAICCRMTTLYKILVQCRATDEVPGSIQAKYSII